MAALDRLYNIAQTGQTDESTAVDNIMAQYKPKNQGGFWNGVKNFAGSNGGRMLLGGLAGTALGALGGRNLNEALTGGIMGATGAAKGITMRNQYNDMIARQQQERADRLRELENGRNFQREMQQNNLAAQKEAANLDFKRRLWEIREGRRYAEQQKANDLSQNDAYIDTLSVDDSEKQRLKAGLRGFNLSAPKSRIETLQEEYLNPDTAPERRAELEPMIEDYYRFQNKLNTLAPKEISFTDAATGLSKISSATDLSADSKNALAEKYGIKTNFTDAPKKYATGDLGTIQYLQDQGMSLDEARRIVGLMSPKEKLSYEAMKAGAVKEAEQPYILEQQNNRAQNDMAFESYKRSLPPEKIIEAGYLAQSLQGEGYNVTAGDILYQGYKKDVLGNANTVANIGQTLASTDKTKAEIPFIPQKMASDIAHTKSQTAKNMYDMNPVQPGTVVNGVTLTGNKTYDTEALKQKAKSESEREKSQLARTRAETQAIKGIKALQELVDDDSLGNFNQSSWNIYPSDATRLAQGKLAGAIAAIAPVAIQRLKDAGVSGISTLSEFMRYVGLPDNPTSKQIEGALPLIMSSIGMTDIGYQSTGGSDLSSVSTNDLVGML